MGLYQSVWQYQVQPFSQIVTIYKIITCSWLKMYWWTTWKVLGNVYHSQSWGIFSKTKICIAIWSHCTWTVMPKKNYIFNKTRRILHSHLITEYLTVFHNHQITLVKFKTHILWQALFSNLCAVQYTYSYTSVLSILFHMRFRILKYHLSNSWNTDTFTKMPDIA